MVCIDSQLLVKTTHPLLLEFVIRQYWYYDILVSITISDYTSVTIVLYIDYLDIAIYFTRQCSIEILQYHDLHLHRQIIFSIHLPNIYRTFVNTNLFKVSFTRASIDHIETDYKDYVDINSNRGQRHSYCRNSFICHRRTCLYLHLFGSWFKAIGCPTSLKLYGSLSERIWFICVMFICASFWYLFLSCDNELINTGVSNSISK